MIQLGDLAEDATVRFHWNTVNRQGAAVTPSTVGSVVVYKDGGVVQVTTGVTDTRSFDSVTGLHLCQLVLTNAWYATGSDYAVVLLGAVIDGQTVNCILAQFSIENRYAKSIYSTPLSVSSS